MTTSRKSNLLWDEPNTLKPRGRAYNLGGACASFPSTGELIVAFNFAVRFHSRDSVDHDHDHLLLAFMEGGHE